MRRITWSLCLAAILLPVQAHAQMLDSRSWEFCGGSAWVFCGALRIDVYADRMMWYVSNTSGEHTRTDRNATLLGFDFANHDALAPFGMTMRGWWDSGHGGQGALAWTSFTGYRWGEWAGAYDNNGSPPVTGSAPVPEGGIASACADSGPAFWFTGGGACGTYEPVEFTFTPHYGDRGFDLNAVGPLTVYAGRMGTDEYASWTESVATTTPEPMTLVLLATGLVGLGTVGWRRSRQGVA